MSGGKSARWPTLVLPENNSTRRGASSTTRSTESTCHDHPPLRLGSSSRQRRRVSSMPGAGGGCAVSVYRLWEVGVSDLETLSKLYLELANVVPADCVSSREIALRRVSNIYGLALMMISQGGADPMKIASDALTKV